MTSELPKGYYVVNPAAYMIWSQSYDWTTDAPTVDGLYRVMASNYAEYWVEVRNVKGEMMIVSREFDDNGWTERLSRITDRFTHWLGPLPVPVSPQDDNE